MLHELIDHELLQALQYAKSIDEETGKRILIQFEIDQPMFFQTLFNVFPTIIAEQQDSDANRDFAQLLADLNFDVLCVYKQAFGKPPLFKDDQNWMERQAMLLDQDLKPLLLNKHVNSKTAQKAKEDFFKPREGEFIQTGLVQFLNESVDEFANNEPYPPHLIELSKAMLFVVVRMFNNLYSQQTT